MTKHARLRHLLLMTTLTLLALLPSAALPAPASANGSGWHVGTLATSASGDTSVAVDRAGMPHISYSDGHHLLYAWFDGADWHYDVADDTQNTGQDSSLEFDSDFEPHISYGFIGDLMYAHYYASSWHNITVESAGWVGVHTSLAIDSNDMPHISYWDMTNEALKYATRSGPVWQIETVHPNIYIADSTSIDLDSADHPHISYYSWNEYLLNYAYRDATRWYTSTVTTEGFSSGSYNSLAVDTAGHVHVSYRGSGLWYGYYNGSTWYHTRVDNNTSVGWSTSLALDGHGRPHIAYLVLVHPYAELRYAWFDGFDWQIVTVDIAPSIGARPEGISIAVDAAGQPHISYHMVGTDELKYATKGIFPVRSRICLPLIRRG